MTTTTAPAPPAAGPAPSGQPPAGHVLFRAGCPHCRESFELTAAALRLAVGGSARTTFYSFTCPECGEAVRKPAGERIVELLTNGGVRTMRLHLA
jgi:PHP family Zn ribbon phosphoesterase